MPTRKLPSGPTVAALDAMATVRREAARAEPDPLDDAMVAALAGVAEAVRGEREGLDALRRRMARLGREALGQVSGRLDQGS